MTQRVAGSLQVGAHGRLADAEHVGRFFRAQALGQRQQYAQLAAGEPVELGEGDRLAHWKHQASDVGAGTLIVIDGDVEQTIRLLGIGNANTVTQDDFLL